MCVCVCGGVQLEKVSWEHFMGFLTHRTISLVHCILPVYPALLPSASLPPFQVQPVSINQGGALPSKSKKKVPLKY